MTKNLIYFATLLLAVATALCNAQPATLIIPKDIVLPRDSMEAKSLFASLTSFLQKAEGPNEQNEFVLPTARLETFVLIDELKGITSDGSRKNKHFYKPYLSNLVPIGNHQYHVQLVYLSADSSRNMLRAAFELIAIKTDAGFQFSSPLLVNTKGWKTKQIGSCIFHYQDVLDKRKASAYSRMVMAYDRKLQSKNKRTELYCCDHLLQLEKLVGVNYKSDYNGQRYGVWSARCSDRSLLLLGNNNASFNKFDPHDLWHERLELATPRSKVNKSVDEGCAYLYGGSWGLSWNEIFTEFRRYVLISSWLIDWQEVKERPVYFKTKTFDNSLDHIANALLIRKIEQKHGFAGVWELLHSGPQEKGNAAYYTVLEKLTGITRATYNESIRVLIDEQR